MFLICRCDTHIATGEKHYHWYGKGLSGTAFENRDAAEKKKLEMAGNFKEREFSRDPDNFQESSPISFVYDYFGATSVEFAVVEVNWLIPTTFRI